MEESVRTHMSSFLINKNPQIFFAERFIEGNVSQGRDISSGKSEGDIEASTTPDRCLTGVGMGDPYE